jgi:HD domain
MTSTKTTIKIPDTKLASEAHDILREYSTDLLYNHSNRVYFFAAEQGRQQGLRFDSELLYVSAAFHDLGLLREYSSESERFEVDGANAEIHYIDLHEDGQGLPRRCHHDAGGPQPGSSQACDDPLLLHGRGQSHQSPQLDWVGGPGGVLTQCHGNRDREIAKKSTISHQRISITRTIQMRGVIL